jgi:aminopeptidase 2
MHVLRRALQYAWSELASEEDAQACEAFFKGKDTSKYTLVLQQTLDGIRAKAKYIEVGSAPHCVFRLLIEAQRSTGDLEEWLQQWN